MKSLLLAASAVTLAVVVPAAGHAPGSRLVGGTAKIYLGGYPDKIYILDEATERVEDTIQLKTGIPNRMGLSQDRKRLYVLNAYLEDIEVADIASRQVADTFRLTQGTTRVRNDTVSWKPVDTWHLSRPIESGVGALRFESNDTLNEEPGYYTGVFTTEDPVQRRRVAGVARINLSQKSLDFFAVGPTQGEIGSFSLAPGGKLAYGLLERVGDYQFWAFDLQARRLRARIPFQGRSRMALKVSSNGSLLYIHEAGNTIDLYEASTGHYVRTVTLDFDMRTDLFILPATTR